MVTIEQIAKRTKMSVAETQELLESRGVMPHKGQKYASIDLERVFDDKFQVREANVPILRTLETHQDIAAKD